MSKVVLHIPVLETDTHASFRAFALKPLYHITRGEAGPFVEYWTTEIPAFS